MELIGTSIGELQVALDTIEDEVSYGDAIILELVGTNGLTQSELDALYKDLATHGFHFSGNITQTHITPLYSLRVPIKKGSPQWAMLIGFIPLIVISGMIAFGIMKIEQISKAILPLILATGGLVIIAIALTREPAMRLIEKW